MLSDGAASLDCLLEFSGTIGTLGGSERLPVTGSPTFGGYTTLPGTLSDPTSLPPPEH